MTTIALIRKSTRMIWLCLAIFQALLVAPSLMANDHANTRDAVTASAFTNGTIGVLRALTMYEVRDARGCKALVIVTTSRSFDKLIHDADFTSGPVYADLEGSKMRLILQGSPSSGRMIGRVLATGQRAYVISKAEYDAKF